MEHVTDPLIPLVWTYRRETLWPRPGTPWLRPPPPALEPLLFACFFLTGILCALSLSLRTLLLTVAGLHGLALLAWGLAGGIRAEIQVCPGCLRSTALGATRCHHCGFQEGG